MRRRSLACALWLGLVAAPATAQVTVGTSRTGFAPTMLLAPLDGAPDGRSVALFAYDRSRSDPAVGLALGQPLGPVSLLIQGALGGHGDEVRAEGEESRYLAGSVQLERGFGPLTGFAAFQADRPAAGTRRLAAPAGVRIELTRPALGLEVTPFVLAAGVLREDGGDGGWRDRGFGALGTAGVRLARGPVWLQASAGMGRGLAGYDPPPGLSVESVTHAAVRLGVALGR